MVMSQIESDLNNIPEEFKKYIFYNFGSFAVKNDKNKVLITFGRFSSQDVACAAVNLLIKYDWDIVSVFDNPISNYLDTFYVFKVMNSHLIFDSKFNSYEKAVEYLEINSKCNDFHNDILHKKKRKSRFKEMKSSESFEDKKIPNIFSKEDNFIVKYNPRGKEYGIFNSLDQAIVAKNILVEHNWNIPDSIEIKFYNSYYWVFRADCNILFFIDKFESYEDALDCLDSNKTPSIKKDNNQKVFGSYIKKIDENYIKGIKNDTYVTEINFKKSIVAKSTINLKHNNKSLLENNTSENRVTSGKKRNKKNFTKERWNVAIGEEVFRENIKIKQMEEIDENIVSLNIENLKPELHIVKFQNNALKDYYSIFFSEGKMEFSENILEFTEFKYIWKLLNFYNWDIEKIKFLSSIHYFNDFYYIIKVFDNKLVVSGEFDSYSEAEENIDFLQNYYSDYSNSSQFDNIEKFGNYYSFSEDHHGRTFEIELIKSLENVKAIIDIFNYFNWDVAVFKEYNFFYYHGLYWEIKYFFYYIKLLGRFNSKDDVLNHKFK